MHPRLLDSGTYGKVYKVVTKKGEEFALKKINIDNIDLIEIDTLIRFKHSNIIQSVEVISSNLYLYIILPYAMKSLYDLSNDIHNIDDSLKNDWMIQLISGVKFLHKYGLYHCDIKPQNILIFGDQQLMLTDFGISLLNINTDGGCLQTSTYRSPEMMYFYNKDAVINQSNISETSLDHFTQIIDNSKTDYWAIGCILIWLIDNTILFPGYNDFMITTKLVEYVSDPDKYLISKISTPNYLKLDSYNLNIIKTLLDLNVTSRSLNKFIDLVNIDDILIYGKYTDVNFKLNPDLLVNYINIFELTHDICVKLLLSNLIYINTLDIIFRQNLYPITPTNYDDLLIFFATSISGEILNNIYIHQMEDFFSTVSKITNNIPILNLINKRLDLVFDLNGLCYNQYILDYEINKKEILEKYTPESFYQKFYSF